MLQIRRFHFNRPATNQHQQAPPTLNSQPQQLSQRTESAVSGAANSVKQESPASFSDFATWTERYLSESSASAQQKLIPEGIDLAQKTASRPNKNH